LSRRENAFTQLLPLSRRTAVVTGGITGTAVYLTAGDADIVTGDQIKTEGWLHILELGHMEPWAIAMMYATLLIGMGTCGACCHKRGKSYVTAKEAKLRDPALGRAKELVQMGAHGTDKLLQDVQTYHDMHHEIVMQKMHQITPPRTGGKYGERPCGNPQCSDCPKPRHIAVGFSSSRQQATILTGNEERGSLPAPSAASSHAAASSQAAAGSHAAEEHAAENSGMDGRSVLPVSTGSSPPRRIAAMTPPRVVSAPSNLFNNGTLADLFISPHFKKWDPIADDRREKTPVDNEDYTGGLNRLLKKQGEQNERDMQDILGHTKRKANKEVKERLLAKQAEQRSRQTFNMLQSPGNKQKLRRPHVFTPAPIGLLLTSADWNKKDLDEWCRRHVSNWHSDRKIIDIVSDDDKMESYYQEGKKLYKVPQRRLMKSDATYDREDLGRDAAAAACTPDDPWE
jgi:hypothetical protein